MFVDRRGPLDLRDHRHGPPGLAHDVERPLDVAGGLHEAQRHEIDAELQPEAQIGRVLVGDGRGRQRHSRRVDALVLPERSAVHDDRHDLVGAQLLHPQLDSAVVQQQPIAAARRLDRAARRACR